MFNESRFNIGCFLFFLVVGFPSGCVMERAAVHYAPSHFETQPDYSSARIGAICEDGWRSSATGSGACSHHGGVHRWLYAETRKVEVIDHTSTTQLLSQLGYLIRMGSMITWMLALLFFGPLLRVYNSTRWPWD